MTNSMQSCMDKCRETLLAADEAFAELIDMAQRQRSYLAQVTQSVTAPALPVSLDKSAQELAGQLTCLRTIEPEPKPNGSGKTAAK